MHSSSLRPEADTSSNKELPSPHKPFLFMDDTQHQPQLPAPFEVPNYVQLNSECPINVNLL